MSNLGIGGKVLDHRICERIRLEVADRELGRYSVGLSWIGRSKSFGMSAETISHVANGYQGHRMYSWVLNARHQEVMLSPLWRGIRD